MSIAGIVLITVLLATMMLPFISLGLLRQRIRKKPTADTRRNESDSTTGDHDTNGGTMKSVPPTTKDKALESAPAVEIQPPNAAISYSVKNITSSGRENGQSPGQTNWRCACEGGFLPPNIFGNMEAVVRMGGGQCYHANR